MTINKPRKRDLKIIDECLRAGISLSMYGSRGERRFTAGQITDQIEGKWLRTTHITASGAGYVWISADAVADLAAQAANKLARKDEILAEQARAHAVAMGR